MKKETPRSDITKNITLISLSIAFFTVCSYIAVPSPSGVSFTLQLFAIFFIAGALDMKKSLTAIILYIAIGFAGIPVFSAFRGGIGVLLGPTGGYILAFIPTVLIIGLAVRIFGKRTSVLIISMLSSLFLCYTIGTIWFVAVSEAYNNTSGIIGALWLCVIPYIIPDIAKIALAVYLCRRSQKFIDFL